MAAVLRVRAPASTANMGPGFDCVGAALDLWNELEITEGSGVSVTGEGAAEIPADDRHLGMRAYATLAPVAGRHFAFHNRIPLERGLGSSAATIALGLVAAATASGKSLSPDELLELALQFEDHPDNLAPSLLGGACVAWHGGGACSARRIADDLPLTPVVVIPPERASTVVARAALPEELPFADAAHTVGRAAMLGAAIAHGDANLFARSLDDRLHEPYRAALSAPYRDLRQALPPGGRGATISGSGPTTIVWTDEAQLELCVSDLEARFGGSEVTAMSVSPTGAGVVA
jgi:homoserine kinase